MLSCLLYLALGWAYPQCSAEFPSAGKHISGIFFILRESQFFFFFSNPLSLLSI